MLQKFFDSCEGGDYDQVLELLQHVEIQQNIAVNDNFALKLAVENGHHKIFNLLLTHQSVLDHEIKGRYSLLKSLSDDFDYLLELIESKSNTSREMQKEKCINAHSSTDEFSVRRKESEAPGAHTLSMTDVRERSQQHREFIGTRYGLKKIAEKLRKIANMSVEMFAQEAILELIEVVTKIYPQKMIFRGYCLRPHDNSLVVGVKLSQEHLNLFEASLTKISTLLSTCSSAKLIDKTTPNLVMLTELFSTMIELDYDLGSLIQTLSQWTNTIALENKTLNFAQIVGLFYLAMHDEKRAISHLSSVNSRSMNYKSAMFVLANIYYNKFDYLTAFEYALKSEDDRFSQTVALSYIEFCYKKSRLNWSEKNYYSNYFWARNYLAFDFQEDNSLSFVKELHLGNYDLKSCIKQLVEYSEDLIASTKIRQLNAAHNLIHFMKNSEQKKENSFINTKNAIKQANLSGIDSISHQENFLPTECAHLSTPLVSENLSDATSVTHRNKENSKKSKHFHLSCPTWVKGTPALVVYKSGSSASKVEFIPDASKKNTKKAHKELHHIQENRSRQGKTPAISGCSTPHKSLSIQPLASMTKRTLAEQVVLKEFTDIVPIIHHNVSNFHPFVAIYKFIDDPSIDRFLKKIDSERDVVFRSESSLNQNGAKLIKVSHEKQCYKTIRIKHCAEREARLIGIGIEFPEDQSILYLVTDFSKKDKELHNGAIFYAEKIAKIKRQLQNMIAEEIVLIPREAEYRLFKPKGSKKEAQNSHNSPIQIEPQLPTQKRRS